MKRKKQSKAKFSLYRKGYNAEKGDFAFSENMYIDPDGAGDALESIPGYRRLHSFRGKINGIFGLGEYIFVHAGDGLYHFCEKERDSIHALTPIRTMKDQESRAFGLGSRCLISDGESLLRIDSSGEAGLISEDERITACTLGAYLNGVLYLSGNPNTPDRIFRLEDEETAEVKLLDIGIDCSWVSSLLGGGDELFIFTDKGVFAYSPAFESLRQVLSGMSVKSDAVYCLNELVFLTDGGLMNGDGEILSEKINHLLLPRLKEARLSVWRGYIAVFCLDRIFLCRRRGAFPDWYCISGIGAYKKDYPLYRYSPYAPDGFALHTHIDGEAEGTVMSVAHEAGELIYYTEEGGVRYSVYPTEERVGGEFFPATCHLSRGNLLYFGTESGDLCIFNNDMRGVAPERISESADFDAEEYKIAFGDRIHPDFYTFLGHRVKYLLMTPDDDLDSPGRRKLSLPNTLTVRCKSFSRSAFDLEVIFDGKSSCERFHIGGSDGDFSDLDFSDFSADAAKTTTLTLPSKNAIFTEKQICIRGEKFASPIGIISLEYGYKIRR